MKEREDSLTTLKLSLELLKRIPKGRTITAPELRQQLIDADSEFKRTPRTIQRLLETLELTRFDGHLIVKSNEKLNQNQTNIQDVNLMQNTIEIQNL